MIDELVVRNLGVIESARIEPASGLTVITGETGTGKTLLLGALRLLLGGDANSALVGPFDVETVVEGRFVDAESIEVGAGRRLPRDGRSRAYLDGSIASARALEERVAGMVDLVGQHDHLTITRSGEVRQLIDRLMDENGRRALADYRSAWSRLREALDAQDELGGDLGALRRELELVTYQGKEISESGFEPGDDIKLETLARRLQNADEIVELISKTLDQIDSGREAIGEAVGLLRKAVRLDDSVELLAERLNAVAESVTEIARDVRAQGDGLESDPARLAEIDSRLNLLGDLRRKYGPAFHHVLEFGDRARVRQAELESLLSRAESIDKEVTEATDAVNDTGAALRKARQHAGDQLAKSAVGHLLDLGFSDPLVSVQVSPAPPSGAGADAPEILFASDSRLKPGSVGSVASGGELSRLVLALRLAGGRGQAETLVFDEVDAGVGGATALALGAKLAELARDRQVLCVTHLPQMAAYADRHYVVERVENTASVVAVEGEERLGELARMLAGLPESERGRQAAGELLELARR